MLLSNSKESPAFRRGEDVKAMGPRPSVLIPGGKLCEAIIDFWLPLWSWWEHCSARTSTDKAAQPEPSAAWLWIRLEVRSPKQKYKLSIRERNPWRAKFRQMLTEGLWPRCCLPESISWL